MKKSKIINVFLIGAIILSMNFCKNIDNKNSIDKSFLEVYYLRQGMHFPMSINCQSINSPIFSKELKYKKITQDSLLKEFSKEFGLLKKEVFHKSVDSRIKILYHHEKKVDTVCMGEVFFISVNGELKQDSPALVRLIRKVLYNN